MPKPTDKELINELVESLERCGCQFFACEGPFVEPVHMKTCHACWTLYNVRQKYPELVKEC